MRINGTVVCVAGLLLTACAGGSYTHDEKAAELARHTLVTTTGGYLMRPGLYGGIGAPDGPLQLYFYQGNSETNSSSTPYDRCAPPSLAAYRSDPAHWQKGRQYCPELFLVALPIGTKIQVDEVSWSWDFENGDRYGIKAHLVDPALGKDEFDIGYTYFVTPDHAADGRLHLDPRYLASEAPAQVP